MANIDHISQTFFNYAAECAHLSLKTNPYLLLYPLLEMCMSPAIFKNSGFLIVLMAKNFIWVHSYNREMFELQ